MHFTKLEQRPNNRELAIKVPRGGLHGHDNHVVESMRYWVDVLRTATEEVDIVRHTLAKAIGVELGTMAWQVRGEDGQDIPRSKRELAYIARYGERDRRRLLGVLAISDLSHILFDTEAGAMQNLDDGQGLGRADVIIDAMSRDGQPLPHRLHLPVATADVLLGEPLSAKEQWYVTEERLFVRRTAASISSPMKWTMDMNGTAYNESGLQTLFPYVTALAPPQPHA